MKPEVLEDLYLEEISEILDGERQTLRLFPKIISAIELEEMRQGFQQHLETTQEQVRRLEQILQRFNTQETSNKCKAMTGMLADIREWLKSGTEDRQLLETAFLINVAKVESYEVACYAGAAILAQYLGFSEDVELLKRSYEEELKMEEKLFALADNLSFEAVESETSLPTS